ncbi:MAG TPA: carbon storage regulator [Gemmataceae bacterium]|nr:carbon storage regulator [Gemmataceae bacterium]
MLVFTRRVDEGIMIGDDIRIIVVGINGGKVRLGFAAPPAVAVVREELCERRPSSLSNGPGGPADPQKPR